MANPTVGGLIHMSVDMSKLRHGTDLLKLGFAQMQEGGVIMDVVTPEQAHVAEDAGATAVMALERVPADIRSDGGVARMSHPDLITGIIETTSIPVMAKARIGHFGEAQVLETLGVDMIDESEVLTPADPYFHIKKKAFTIPFVCGATHLGEAVRRIHEGAAMIRTKGEAGTGNLVSAVTHARLITAEIAAISEEDSNHSAVASEIISRYEVLSLKVTDNVGSAVAQTPFGPIDDTMQEEIIGILKEITAAGRLPVVTHSAGGIATPADAAMMMQLGMDGLFVGSGIFKSEDPTTTARAIVMATHNFNDAEKVAEACRMTGKAMAGLELDELEVRLEERGW
jgi:pyridoxal 5'-phosphate synthase pdxS subunit